MKPKKKNEPPAIEYQYEPSQDADEKLNQAYDIILDLIIQDYTDEQNDKPQQDNPPQAGAS